MEKSGANTFCLVSWSVCLVDTKSTGRQWETGRQSESGRISTNGKDILRIKNNLGNVF